VHKMPLVEIVRSPGSGEPVIAALVQVVRQLGKVPIVVAERPGFLVNRALFPYLDEAVRLVCEGVSVAEVDRAALRFGMPMGPLELLDQVGIDVAADVARSLAHLGAEESPTPDRLAEMAKSGLLGKKSDAGFYKFRDGKKTKPVNQEGNAIGSGVRVEPVRLGDHDELTGVQQRLMFALLNESAKCLHEKIVREAWMVDLGLVMGSGYAPFRGGPMQTIDDWGVRNCLDVLEYLAKQCGPRFTPCPLLQELSEHGETLSKADRSGALAASAGR